MSSTRKFPKSKILPKDEPNPGEKLVIKNLATDGSGSYSWHYAPLTKQQIASIKGSPDDRAIEIRVKNFDVSNLSAALDNFPNNKNAIKLLLVVELDKAYAAATEHAVELIKTVGIPDSANMAGVAWIAEGRDQQIRVQQGRRDQSIMRRALFGAVSVQFDESTIDGQQVLQFWEDIAYVRRGHWDSAEIERWVHVKWAVKSKLEKNTGTAATLALWCGVAAVAVAGTLWASNLI